MSKISISVRRVFMGVLLLASSFLPIASQTTMDSIVNMPVVEADANGTTNVTQDGKELHEQDVDQDTAVCLTHIVLFLLFVGLTVVVYKTNREITQTLKGLRKQIDGLNADMEEIEDKMDQQVKSSKPHIKEFETAEVNRQSKLTQTERKDAALYITTDRHTKTTPPKQTAYATISLNNGKLIINHRSITTDPAGKMFQINYYDGKDEGSYVINPKMTGVALSTLNTLCEYVNFKKPSKKPKGLVTHAAGIIKKYGADWVVTNKLEITFEY